MQCFLISPSGKKELAEAQENNFYRYLKRKYHPNSTINIEISIKSKTFKKTINGYECNSDDYEKYYNKIDRFDENEFKIFALEHPLNIPYEKLDAWWYDKSKSDKINLYLNMVVVLYSKQKLELEDLDKIQTYHPDNG